MKATLPQVRVFKVDTIGAKACQVEAPEVPAFEYHVSDSALMGKEWLKHLSRFGIHG
jgi:hypothetical protein